MKAVAVVFLLLSVAFAQNAVPTATRVEWNPSAPGSLKELPDGRVQRTVTGAGAGVSVIVDVVPARRFIDPPADGGADVTYVIIGIQNTSRQPVHIDPSRITLRAVGKKERELQRLSEEKVVARAWDTVDRSIGALPAMTGSALSGGGNDSRDVAVSHRELGSSSRTAQASEQQTGMQSAKLKDKALLARDLDPGKSVMGMVFFLPYEKKDQLELTVGVGETTFVIRFSGKKK
ncbi:MAG: hypothetical protein L0Z53_26315 [Acidobacteriales bacterium]|nr:hypothetical protein [Terriglobales bacterium]